MNELQYCEILKTRINVTNMGDTLNYIKTHLDELRGRYICVSNVHTTVMSYENEAYRNIQNSAAMALPDGAPLSIYSRKNGFDGARRVTGPDLMLELLKSRTVSGVPIRHFFYGSTQQTLEAIRSRVENNYRDAVVAGMYSPPFGALSESEDEEIIKQINASAPDIIWIGLGAPKQERFMYSHRGSFDAVMIGVGAGFDYLAGNIKRAPKLMQQLSLEWLYRFMQDPRRLWRRYVVTNFKFIKYINREKRLNCGK